MHYQNDRLVCRREEMGFQFWFKRRWRRILHTERKRVPEHRSNVLQGSLPQGLSAHPRNMEDPSIWGWVKRARRRVEMKQLRQVWRSRTRDNVEADENYFALNPAADWKPVEIVKWRSDAGRFRIFADEVSCRVDHSDFYQLQGPKERITTIKPGENKRENKLWQFQKKDTVGSNLSAHHIQYLILHKVQCTKNLRLQRTVLNTNFLVFNKSDTSHFITLNNKLHSTPDVS